jgi:hypothetical protein
MALKEQHLRHAALLLIDHLPWITRMLWRFWRMFASS